MNPDDFKSQETGRFVPTIQGCMAFVPSPLPPPLIDLAPLVPSLARATKALGELSGVGRTLPNPYLLIRPFMRREAVASSKIEGTVTTLSDLFSFEVDEAKSRTPADTREVLNYVRALEFALNRVSVLPVSSRLIREAHQILLSGVDQHRGGNIVPGELKTDQNWIGARLIQNARYIPPPPNESIECMASLEKYINSTDDELPIIIRLALIHYQFEAIHPFPDGNGRIGRLLIPLILCEQKELSQPLLYLSSYFEKRYDEYIDNMLAVSQYGLWGRWIEFFLAGIEETCNDAITKAQNLQDLHNRYRATIQQAKSSALLGHIIDLLFEHPVVTIPHAAERLNITYNAAKNNVGRLVAHKILNPSSFPGRPQIFFAEEIIETLSA